MKEVYVLKASVKHLDNEKAFDAVLDDFPGAKSITPYLTSKTYNIEGKTFHFSSKFSNLDNRDFLFTNVGWPIFSKKLYQVVSAFDFPHKVFNVEVTLSNGEKLQNSFKALQIIPEKELVDLKNSIFKESAAMPGRISFFRKLVLSKPIEGFKPIFKVKESPSKLFITTDLKTALEAAEIKGINIIHVDKYDWHLGKQIE